MMLSVTDLSSEPIHGQIARQLVERIIDGDYGAGREMPEVRKLARMLHVSAQGVEKAYSALERDGLVRRGDDGGTYVVAPLEPRQREAARRRYLGRQLFSPDVYLEELDMARRIQAGLLPKALPCDGPVCMAAYSAPSRMVGGDFYDCLPIDEHRFGVVIADASGKGLPAAMMITQIQVMMRSEVNHGNSIRKVLENVNNQLARFSPSDRFVSLFYGVYDTRTGVFEFANAGHNHPVVVRRGGPYECLDTDGHLLGVFTGSRYEVRAVTLSPGDFIFFYTDGVTETMNAAETEYGEERLRGCLSENRERDAEGLIDAVLADLGEFHDAGPLQDDRTMVVLKIREVA